MFKKLTSMVLAGVMALSVMASVTAADINQSGGSGDSKVTLDIGSRSLKVTVPSVLPIWVDSDNNVTVATNAKIQNRSEGPVDVTDVSVEADNNWSLVNFNTDFSKVPVDTKQYGMTMYNDDVIDGVDLSLFDRINGSDEIAVVYDGNVAIQSSDINKLDIGHVVFTVAWADGERLGVNDITYNVENAAVQAYMAHPDYDWSDHSYTNMTNITFGSNDGSPNTGTLSVPNDAASIVVTSVADGVTFTDGLSGDSYAVKNLVPNQVYDYQMKDSLGTVVKQGKIYPTGRLRMIDSEGSSINNIRDLGGWRADGAGALRYGRIFRGPRLEDSSSRLRSVMTDFLGITSEIDLRNEVSSTVSVLGDVDYSRYPVAAYAAKPYNTSQSASLKSVFEKIANDLSAGKNIYIHCAAGADRTALVCALLEGICGVSDSDIERDYELSSFFAARRYRNGSDLADWPAFVDDANTYLRGSSLRDKSLYYLQWIGVSDDDINTIRRELIDTNVPVISRKATEVFDKTNAVLNSRLGSSGNISSYSVSDGNILVTDWIPVTKSDIITICSDMAQSDTYAGYGQAYDGNHARLLTAAKGTTSVWSWNSSMTEGTFKLWNMYRAVDISSWDVQYMRFIIQYRDIDSISIIKT